MNISVWYETQRGSLLIATTQIPALLCKTADLLIITLTCASGIVSYIFYASIVDLDQTFMMRTEDPPYI